MTRIVSVTPLALERDSRTLKHAASFARLGYESVVVEGESGAAPIGSLPFAVVTAAEPVGRDAHPAETKPQPPGGPGDGSPPSRVAALIDRAASPLRRERARWSAAYRFLRDYWRINRRTLAALPEADLYWLHSYWQFPAVYRKARRNGARVVYDAHDSYRDLPRLTLPIAPSVLAMIERLCVRKSAARSTVSAGVARRLRVLFGREFAVIRNCHELRLDRPARKTIREALDLAAGDFLIVMVGQRKPGLALDEAVAALDQGEAPVHFAMVGSGFDREGSSIAVGRSRLHFLPAVEPTQLVDFIRGADAATVLYKPEGESLANALPNGFFHAIAAGLPVLHPPLAEIRRLSEEFDLGPAVDPSAPGSIAAAIDGLVAAPKGLAKFRENVERARAELTWEHEEPKLARIAAAAVGDTETEGLG